MKLLTFTKMKCKKSYILMAFINMNDKPHGDNLVAANSIVYAFMQFKWYRFTENTYMNEDFLIVPYTAMAMWFEPFI